MDSRVVGMIHSNHNRLDYKVKQPWLSGSKTNKTNFAFLGWGLSRDQLPSEILDGPNSDIYKPAR